MTEIAPREDIAHLDFTVEVELPSIPPTIRHYAHPTDPSKCWCGAKSSWLGYTGNAATPASEINCVGCLHELIDKGREWWWEVHNAFYRSSCNPNAHYCEHAV